MSLDMGDSLSFSCICSFIHSKSISQASSMFVSGIVFSLEK
jgi:hypothetical protein